MKGTFFSDLTNHLYFRFHGKKDPYGLASGEGGLMYENKDTFTGIFINGILNRYIN